MCVGRVDLDSAVGLLPGTGGFQPSKGLLFAEVGVFLGVALGGDFGAVFACLGKADARAAASEANLALADLAGCVAKAGLGEPCCGVFLGIGRI